MSDLATISHDVYSHKPGKQDHPITILNDSVIIHVKKYTTLEVVRILTLFGT